MNRQQATKLLRDLLDEQGLRDWKLALTIDTYKPFFGMCDAKNKRIILNAHHVDTHPDVEVINTIKHEVAHALTTGHGHDDTWIAKAKELGCDDVSPCATYSLNPDAIDAIRSGAQLEISYEERVVREPKYKITRLQEKCHVCGKVAKAKSVKIYKTSGGHKKVVTLECGHIEIKDADSYSPFKDLTFDGNPTCVHAWTHPLDDRVKYKTICGKCDAKRLYPFQIEGAQALESANGRFALFDDMGLGKTIMPLAYLKYHPEALKYLWVTKSGTKYQHAREIVRVLGMPYFPQVLAKGTDKLIPAFKGYLASYDMFRRIDLEQFAKVGIKTIVLDECQAIKNPDSTRTQCIRRIAKDIPKIIPASGTFWKNRGSEAFVVLNMLDPQRFYSFEDFKRRHVEMYWHGGKLKEGGLRKNFIDEIRDIAIRRERVNVMPELPLINRTRVLCEVPESARHVYNEAQAQLINDYNEAVIGGEEDSFETHQKLMQSLIIMRQVVGLAKVPATVEFAKEFLEETDRKLVIFVHHKKCGELIFNQLNEWCIENEYEPVLRITADMNPGARFETQTLFNSDKHRIMVASTLASGEGLNLQSCSDCIMHERQWNPANEEQAEGRFIRIGQQASSVNATYIHADDSVDTDLNSIVEGKRVRFHNSMNKGEMPTWNEQNIVKELAAAIASKAKKLVTV